MRAHRHDDVPAEDDRAIRPVLRAHARRLAHPRAHLLTPAPRVLPQEQGPPDAPRAILKEEAERGVVRSANLLVGTANLRSCPTCTINGPVSLCLQTIRPHFKGMVRSCNVRDNCKRGVDRPQQLPRQVVRFLNVAAGKVDWSTEMEKILLKAARAGDDISPLDYPDSARDLREALIRFPLAGKQVLVGGSITPWVEVTLAVAGVGSITTSDYQERVVASDVTTFVHVGAIARSSFDAIVSFSSIEHDGLGRYCDPINPNGDYAAMAEFRAWLKPGGLLFLGVPVGPFEPYRLFGGNKHRIYGSQRFSNLTRGFKLLHSDFSRLKPQMGGAMWPSGQLAEKAAVLGAGMQPIHVLQKPAAAGGGGRGPRSTLLPREGAGRV